MFVSFFQYVITYTHTQEYIFCILCVVLKFTVSFGFFKVSHIRYKNTALFIFQSMVVWTRMVPKCLHICMLSPQLMDCLKRTKRYVLVGVGVLLGMCSEGPKVQALLFIQSAPSLSATCGSRCEDIKFSAMLQCHACLLPTMIMN